MVTRTHDASPGGVAVFVRLVAAQLAAREYRVTVEMAGCGLAHFGDVTRLWECLGLARWMQGVDDPARYALESASILAPLHPFSQCALLDLYTRNEDARAAGAIADFLGGDFPSAAFLAAVTDESKRLGGLELALRAACALAEATPYHHRALFALAWCLGRMGASWEQLVGPLALAMDLAPECLHYRVNLAFAWADGGRWGHAYDLLLPVGEGEIDCPCWLRRMEEVFARSGDGERAAACRRRFGVLASLAGAHRNG